MTNLRVLSNAQWRSIDEQIAEVIREEATILNILPNKKGKAWANVADFAEPTEMKQYESGQEFHYREANNVSRKWNHNFYDYIDVPVYLDEKSIRSSENDGMMSLIAQAEMELLAYLIERMEMSLFHGSLKTGTEGITNFTTATTRCNISSNAAAGLWTTAQNFATDIEIAIATLRAAHITPPYIFIGTPGIQSELRNNYIANIGNELKEFKETYVPNTISKMYFTDRILDLDTTPLAVGNQRFIIMKQGAQYSYLSESVGISRMELPYNKQAEADMSYVLRAAICPIVKNCDSIAMIHTGTTSTAY